jgi:hypothetical protein
MNVAARAEALFASRWLFVAWGLASAALLVATSYVDPYIFGLSAFGAAALSGLLVMGTALLHWRNVVLQVGLTTASAGVRRNKW